ncbi:MAG: hypothetical protein KH355_01490 [Clostridiales bacterium]|nr:hypothetical protein [Clostridiales bacterium]
MTNKELRKLSRVALLEMLVEMGKKNEALQAENELLRQRQEDREIRIQNAGSIAKAALELNKVFEDAQAAADQYLLNIQQLQEREKQQLDEIEQQVNELVKEKVEETAKALEEAKRKAEHIIKEAQEQAKIITENAKKEAEKNKISTP